MTSNLEQLKKKIQEANPEIMKLKFGCEVEYLNGDYGSYVVIAETSICQKHKTQKGCDGHYDRTYDVCDYDSAVMLLNDNESGVGTLNVKTDTIKLYQIYGRPIRLADVLLTIHKINPYSYFIDIAGEFWKWADFDSAPERLEIKYNLKSDSLDLQSEETINFLWGLLCQ